jgi:hypothetical protein
MDESEHTEPRAEDDVPKRRHDSRRHKVAPVDEDLRAADRRIRKPGLVGLLCDMFGFGHRDGKWP